MRTTQRRCDIWKKKCQSPQGHSKNFIQRQQCLLHANAKNYEIKIEALAFTLQSNFQCGVRPAKIIIYIV